MLCRIMGSDYKNELMEHVDTGIVKVSPHIHMHAPTRTLPPVAPYILPLFVYTLCINQLPPAPV